MFGFSPRRGLKLVRALLALFLLNANESVPRDVLVDRLG